MENYPFVRCLEPKRIFNPYINDWLVVPCGKCRACQCSKGSRYKLQIQLEASCHKFCIFGTLTYANTYIPRLSLVPYNDKTFGVVNGYEMYDIETGEYKGYLDSPSYDVQPLLDKLHLFGHVPYLRKTDLQLFFKRLRKNLSKYSDAKVRYFAMGEYGPVHFRPHYHFLLFFDAIEFTQASGHTLGEFPDWTWYDSKNQCPVATCYRKWNTLYVKHGPLVVSMRNTPKVTLHNMFRRMLVVLALYPKFIKCHPRVRSRYILDSWVKVFLRLNVKKYMKLPLETLLKEASNSMALIRNLTYGGRVTLSFTPSVKDLLVNLHLCVCTLINYTIPQSVSSRMSKRSLNSHVKR